MRLSQILFTQGFGSRRECSGLIWHGLVEVDGRVLEEDEDFDPKGLVLTVQGKTWPVYEKALILLNKPAGYECSQKPKHHPSVMSLLPVPLRQRGVQPVGRLDEDTTGLLLLTDDGNLIHRLTSPKKQVNKVYEVTAKHPIDDDQLARLMAGVVLDDDPAIVIPVAAELTSPHHLRLTLHEGKYHQVKRMLAAVGNRCEALHRSAFGAATVPADLAPGQWCWLTGPEAVLGQA